MDKDFLKTVSQGLSRRDALKLSAILAASPLLASSLEAEDEQNETKKPIKTKAKILIVGGGDAGITISARLSRLLETPDITIIEPRAKHFYQPGQTLVGGGVWDLDDIAFDTADFIPSGVKWITQKAQSFDPSHNMVHLESGEKVPYDYMVLCTGLELRYDFIEGMKQDLLGTKNIHSIYKPEASAHVFSGFKDLVEKAKTQKVNALFTHPNTPIKCGGAPKKIMYLAEHYLREQGVRDNVNLTFLPAGGKYFGLDSYDKAIKKQFEEKGLKASFRHDLTKIDSEKGIATFDHKYEVKGEWDEDLEEFDIIAKQKNIELEFDFIHVTPPMQTHKVVKDSELSWKKGGLGAAGLIDVDEYTLQHKQFSNVFGAGDVIGTRFGKTGGSVRKQAPVVANNLVCLIEGKPFSHKYNGYTVCPLVTGYGSVMLAEFDYDGEAPSFPLDPAQSRWLWWLLKVYALKPMYFNGMLRGRM